MSDLAYQFKKGYLDQASNDKFLSVSSHPNFSNCKLILNESSFYRIDKLYTRSLSVHLIRQNYPLSINNEAY